MGFKRLVGGDFNTEQCRGWRGDRFEELLCELDLDVCNKSALLPFDEAWTFNRCLGTKRILDYCLAETRIQVQSSKAIDGLVLRSDHRAVQTCLLIPPEIRPASERKRKRRTNWQEYQNVAVNENCTRSNVLPDLENELRDIAEGCDENGTKSADRPWDSKELRTLRARRRSVVSAKERKEVSKAIWRLT